MFEINNVLYFVGQKGISTLNDEVHKFPSNKEYGWCSTCRVGDNIFVVSKYYDDDNKVESSLFNPINKQWSDANIKIKRKKIALVYFLNKVWIIGGYKRDDDGTRKKLNTVEVYDPVTKYQVLAPIKMNEARSSHKVIVYKNDLFVFGGHGNDGYLNSVEMYSPGSYKFVTMAPMKTARCGFACCRVGNLVYVVGGYSDGGQTNSVEIYNLDTNTWVDGGDISDAANDHFAAVYACAVNDKLEY